MMNKEQLNKGGILSEILNDLDENHIERVGKKMALAARIADAIKSAGYSKQRFAQLMGQSPSVVSKWLSGTHNFTSDTLWDIEEKLGIELISLEEGKKVDEIVNVYKVEVQVKVSAFAYSDLSPKGKSSQFILPGNSFSTSIKEKYLKHVN